MNNEIVTIPQYAYSDWVEPGKDMYEYWWIDDPRNFREYTSSCRPRVYYRDPSIGPTMIMHYGNISGKIQQEVWTGITPNVMDVPYGTNICHRHRLNGPAVIYYDYNSMMCDTEWWIHGQKYSFNDWATRLKLPESDQVALKLTFG